MVFADTHAHLYAKQFDTDRSVMVQRAIDQGVKNIYLPNVDSQSIQALYDLVTQFPDNCFAMMGIHPCSIKADFEKELAMAKTALDAPPCTFYAVGEIGLDYYWDLTYQAEQKEALKTQIAWAKEKKLPIVLHCRDAFDDLYEIVAAMNDDNLTGIFHCFSGTLEEARKVMDLGGFYMGIGGPVTYKKTSLIEVLPQIGLSHILLETDAPYLVPAPYRYEKKKKGNKRNESAYVPLIAQRIAEITGKTLAEVAEITSQNAAVVFKRKRRNEELIINN